MSSNSPAWRGVQGGGGGKSDQWSVVSDQWSEVRDWQATFRGVGDMGVPVVYAAAYKASGQNRMTETDD